MTCHVARRAGEFVHRLRRDRREARHALVTTDAELVGYTRDHPGDVLDDAATDTTCRLLAKLEERDRRVLEEIDAAEERLAKGTFGVCEACARRIPFERLQALPAARLCVTCEDRAERVMRRGTAAVARAAAFVGLVLLVGVAPVFAQAPMTGGPGRPMATTSGATGEPREAAAMPMMDMCRHMMAGPAASVSADPKMDPTMKMDPAMMAHMLEMRGEMMKAMGESMMKHGAMMRGGAT